MSDIISKIRELSRNNENEKIEQLIEDHLKIEPNNIELLLRLALVELYPPFADYEKSAICVEKILAIDKNNIFGVLLLAYLYPFYKGTADTILLDKINSIDTDSNEVKSMLKYVLSRSTLQKDEEKKLLKESITLFNGHVLNYVRLAQLYFEQGKKSEAEELVRKALANVQKVYSDKETKKSDSTDINEFVNELIKGIHLTKVNFESIQELLNQ